MVTELDACARVKGHEPAQKRLAVNEGTGCEVASVQVGQVERVVDQVVIPPVR